MPGAAPPLRLLVSEIASDETPRRALVRVRVAGQPEIAKAVRKGDRDSRGIEGDDRTASVVDVIPRGSDAIEVVLALGLDRGRDGWRYKSAVLNPGSTFSFVSDRSAWSGSVVNVVLDEP